MLTRLKQWIIRACGGGELIQRAWVGKELNTLDVGTYRVDVACNDHVIPTRPGAKYFWLDDSVLIVSEMITPSPEVVAAQKSIDQLAPGDYSLNIAIASNTEKEITIKQAYCIHRKTD